MSTFFLPDYDLIEKEGLAFAPPSRYFGWGAKYGPSAISSLLIVLPAEEALPKASEQAIRELEELIARTEALVAESLEGVDVGDEFGTDAWGALSPSAERTWERLSGLQGGAPFRTDDPLLQSL